MKPGDVVELLVEKGVYRGRGLAREAGRVVFVAGALPGDRVRARVEKVKRDWAEARIERLEAPSPQRRPAPCAHAARCGGCAYQELAPAAQVELKRGILVESLERARVPLAGVEVGVTASPEAGWRWRGRMHVDWIDGRPRLGFREEGAHSLVEVDRCPQFTAGLQALAAELRNGLVADPGGLSGVRELRLAEGGDGVTRVAALAVEGRLEPGAAARLAERVPGATGLGWQGSGPGAPFVRIAGEPCVFTPRPEGVLRSHVLSFFQGNAACLDALVLRALETVSGADRVLELYAGVGLFTLPLARRTSHVRAVEAAPWAVEDARHNLAEHPTVQLVEDDVLRDTHAWARGRFDAALLDPPRAGAGPEVVDALARARVGRIGYVSCDPTTLARDLRRLGEHGFALRSLHLLDLFPDTFHLEAVAALER
ncbi:MAG: class I SAM-dependent RNA methyltransferase [Vicinamibacteria bacterium]|nr:class I SAM-dependent RNA methyltransferase [Vicinamibacteria bacterium]